MSKGLGLKSSEYSAYSQVELLTYLYSLIQKLVGVLQILNSLYKVLLSECAETSSQNLNSWIGLSGNF